jgi:dienelactone hydrolase
VGRNRAAKVLSAATALIAAGLGGCSASGGSSSRANTVAVIHVDRPTSLADQAVHVRVSGLAPRTTVTVTSQATDYSGQAWQAHALYATDAKGTLDLATTAPSSGTYSGRDAMGLFWSMNPSPANPKAFQFFPPFQASYDILLSVSAHGRLLTTSNLVRQLTADGVTGHPLTVAGDKVNGQLFLPAHDEGHHPAVLVFGGSEGGDSQVHTAELLASHGYPALALGYFGLPGLPTTLQNIPLEYFASAARILAAQPGVDPTKILAMGYSRGSEAALLLADDYPRLIHAVVVYSPSAQVNAGFPSGPTAWTKDGKPVPTGLIPLNHVNGPLLAIAGSSDNLWASPTWARQIAHELTADHDSQPHQALVYPNAGHLVGTFPYLAADTTQTRADTGATEDLGGTRAADEAAQAAGWPRVLALLQSLEAG